MLKNIRLHIEQDEQKQNALEQALAAKISSTHKNNINAFQRTIPSLLKYILPQEQQSVSIFCNKFGEYNLVDYGIGRAVYGFHPEKEIKQQVKVFKRNSKFINLTPPRSQSAPPPKKNKYSQELLAQLPHLEKVLKNPPFPKNTDCLVMLGCGLGIQIKELLESSNIKHLIVYEAQSQFFSASTSVTNWKEILELASAKGTSLYLQIGNDGRDVISDIQELTIRFPIRGFHVYKHFNHPIYDCVYKQLNTQSWDKLAGSGLSFEFEEDPNRYTPLWTAPKQLQHYQSIGKNHPTFINNLNSFQRYYPNIYEEFKDYAPQNWIPVITKNGQINVIEKENLTSWYSDSPKTDSNRSFSSFASHPNIDGLELGYSGEKLAHYAHYMFVKKAEKLLKEHQEVKGSLPKHVQSIIMFGLGLGYQLPTLFSKHSIENIFICEPNRDYFYASLFAIDWEDIFIQVELSEARIYLNIGDDGTNLFRDLVGQFYSIGPYILNNTYFYQSYYNAPLNKAIAQLREQLKVVISIGEYFDHAYYGISHTTEGIRRNYPCLRHSPSNYLTIDDKDVPIFLVGNGPSLDHSIATIKEWKNKAIIVSCGTTLKVLHKHDITPDFHAEIEQNRSSYDWSNVIGDPAYLKEISLISCNGIHPDTCDLFKDVFITLKDGESSTVSATNIIGEANVEIIKFAFPTVSNFAFNLFSIFEFTSIYLIGVDLGFIDKKHHHSKTSDYYHEDGKEKGDYSSKYNTSLVVEGNFRPTVLTKPEFKLSKQIIEKSIANTSKNSIIYNCSDGAKINGAQPLALEQILITTAEEIKDEVIEKIKIKAFSKKLNQGYLQEFETKFSIEQLKIDLSAFSKIASTPIKTNKDALALIKNQKQQLLESYNRGNSLFFYYMYGTVNYAQAVLTKLIDHKYQSKQAAPEVATFQTTWIDLLSTISHMSVRKNVIYDSTLTKGSMHKERSIVRQATQKQNLLIVSNSDEFIEFIQWLVKNWHKIEINVKIVNPVDVQLHSNIHFDYILYYDDKFLPNESIETKYKDFTFKSKINTLAIIHTNENQAINLHNDYPDISFMPVVWGKFKTTRNEVVASNYHLAFWALKACLDGSNGEIILPKHSISEHLPEETFQSFEHLNNAPQYDVLEYFYYLKVTEVEKSKSHQLSNGGIRGKYISWNEVYKHRVYEELSAKEFNGLLERKKLVNLPRVL